MFENFRLPRLNEIKDVDTKKVIAVLKEATDTRFKEYLDKVFQRPSDKPKRIEHTHRHERDWLELEVTYLSDNTTFYSAYMDVNHSGQKDYVLITKVEYSLTKRNAAFEKKTIGLNASLYSYTPIYKDGSYKQPEKHSRFSLRGHPFYYRGRFYVVDFNYSSSPESTWVSVYIYEPKVPFMSREGVDMGRAVCQLRMKP